MSKTKVYLEIDSFFLQSISIMSGKSEKELLFIFSDKATVLADQIMDAGFKSNWSMTGFYIDGCPMKIKLKVKYTGSRGRKIGDISCTFDVGTGRHLKYDTEELLAEMVEAKLLRGEI